MPHKERRDKIKTATKEVKTEAKTASQETPLSLIAPVSKAKATKSESKLSPDAKIPKGWEKVPVGDYNYSRAAAAVDEWVKIQRKDSTPRTLWGAKITSGIRNRRPHHDGAQETKETDALCNAGLVIGKEFIVTTSKDTKKKEVTAEYRADYDPEKGKHFNILLNPHTDGAKFVFAFGDAKADSVEVEKHIATDKDVVLKKRKGNWELYAYLTEETQKTKDDSMTPSEALKFINHYELYERDKTAHYNTKDFPDLISFREYFNTLKFFKVLKPVNEIAKHAVETASEEVKNRPGQNS